MRRPKVANIAIGLCIGSLVMMGLMWIGITRATDINLEKQFEANTEQIANQFGVTLDQGALEEVYKNEEILAPVGRTDADLTKIVYGSYLDGNVLLFVSTGKEYFPLGAPGKRYFDFDRFNFDRDNLNEDLGELEDGLNLEGDLELEDN